MAMTAAATATDLDEPTRPVDRPSTADRVFRMVATAAAYTSLVIIGLTFVFLLLESRQALSGVGVIDFFTDSVWNPSLEQIGVWGLLIGTILIAVIATCTAVPMALAMALFINEYAPRRIRTGLTAVVDLLAALPSLIYGLWGFYALQPRMVPIARWISEHFSVIPLLRVTDTQARFTSSSLIAGVVVGIMITPIITSISRDVMSQVPREQCEGALALGGSRWGMIREVILPFGRSGIVGATLLGFGRALGETIAVALIIVPTVEANWNVLESGAGSIAANIVQRFGEAVEVERSALVASGLALFTLTFVVNLLARRIVNRMKVV